MSDEVKVIDANQLHDFEKKALMDMGWDGKSVVPLNFYDQLAKDVEIIKGSNITDIVKELNEVKMPDSEGIYDPDSGLKVPIQELGEDVDLQKFYLDSINKAKSYTKPEDQLDETDTLKKTAKNIFERTQKELDDRKEFENVSPEVAEVLKKVKTSDSGQKEEKIKEVDKYSFVSKEDRQAYAEACIANTPMYKSYEAFSGQLVITFRDLTAEDLDMLVMQDTIDRTSGRTRADIAQMQANISNYAIAGRLVSIFNKKNNNYLFRVPGSEPVSSYASKFMASSPDNVDNLRDFKITQDTAIRFWYLFSTKLISPNVWNLVKKFHADFLTLILALEELAKQNDFF
jgi:hypothetical protein